MAATSPITPRGAAMALAGPGAMALAMRRGAKASAQGAQARVSSPMAAGVTASGAMAHPATAMKDLSPVAEREPSAGGLRAMRMGAVQARALAAAPDARASETGTSATTQGAASAPMTGAGGFTPTKGARATPLRAGAMMACALAALTAAPGARALSAGLAAGALATAAGALRAAASAAGADGRI